MLEAWIADLSAAAPVALTVAEEARVARMVAAVAWGLARGHAADVGDAMIR